MDLYKKILDATASYVDAYTIENFKKVNEMIIKLMTYTITYDDLLARGIPKEVIDEGMARFNNHQSSHWANRRDAKVSGDILISRDTIPSHIRKKYDIHTTKDINDL